MLHLNIYFDNVISQLWDVTEINFNLQTKKILFNNESINAINQEIRFTHGMRVAPGATPQAPSSAAGGRFWNVDVSSLAEFTSHHKCRHDHK